MIIFRMSDGFGNQLWVYGAAYHFAKQLGEDIVFDTSALDAPWYFREFALGHYRVRIDKRVTYLFNDGFLDHLFWNHYYRRRAIGLATKTVREKEIGDKNLTILHSRFKSLYMIGYWQKMEYIQDVEEELRRMYIYKDQLSDNARIFKEKIENRNSVAVHVRRGDYADMGCAIGSYYYKESMLDINSRLNQTGLFFVFSEDLEWTRNAFCNLPLSIEYVDFVSPNKDVEDFELMRSCKHQICSHSTYSWWAAWLNENKNKMIIFPNDGEQYDRALWLDSWIPHATKSR